MSADDRPPLADEYADRVGRWLTETDLTGLPESAAPIAIPPPDAPVTVVRPVRLPYEMDAMVKALAQARGVPMSALIRDWIAAGLAEAGQAPDPVSALRRGLDAAQRALDALTRARPAVRNDPA